MVPDAQLSEAVNLIQKKRHDAEMTNLLKLHFEERIAALKTAVEAVIEEKSTAKIKYEHCNLIYYLNINHYFLYIA
jgi:hypothetical protein